MPFSTFWRSSWMTSRIRPPPPPAGASARHAPFPPQRMPWRQQGQSPAAPSSTEPLTRATSRGSAAGGPAHPAGTSSAGAGAPSSSENHTHLPPPLRPVGSSVASGTQLDWMACGAAGPAFTRARRGPCCASASTPAAARRRRPPIHAAVPGGGAPHSPATPLGRTRGIGPCARAATTTPCRRGRQALPRSVVGVAHKACLQRRRCCSGRGGGGRRRRQPLRPLL
ncbi:hypothetical protein PVAP13_1NG543700 [Panicum virgatum]|uniref:Uncharacterized protein n=1 Tax=Panicum virgatum TaxID=38727 RepID=A0A8T0X578_PANVG|nr:hypothetical protein PVAP13_1NG543700 [Panicum virgatum]